VGFHEDWPNQQQEGPEAPHTEMATAYEGSVREGTQGGNGQQGVSEGATATENPGGRGLLDVSGAGAPSLPPAPPGACPSCLCLSIFPGVQGLHPLARTSGKRSKT
jgi:hypothetical protein